MIATIPQQQCRSTLILALSHKPGQTAIERILEVKKEKMEDAELDGLRSTAKFYRAQIELLEELKMLEER